jgi:hypothetical protein
MTDYITEDMQVARFGSLLRGLRATLGKGHDPSEADMDFVVDYLVALEAWEDHVLMPAVDSLIEVHRATGIDLKHAPDWLRLTQSARPDFSIEGEPEW